MQVKTGKNKKKVIQEEEKIKLTKGEEIIFYFIWLDYFYKPHVIWDTLIEFYKEYIYIPKENLEISSEFKDLIFQATHKCYKAYADHQEAMYEFIQSVQESINHDSMAEFYEIQQRFPTQQCYKFE